MTMHPAPDSPGPHAAAATADPAISATAAQWVARIDRGLTAAEQREFAAWRSAHPRHAAEFQRVNAAWCSLDGLAAAPDLAAQADGIAERARLRGARRRLARGVGFFAAAAAAIALGVATWNFAGADAMPPGLPNENYRVLASTVERVTLPDGSVAELNGASRIEVDFTAAERRVRLAEGEAHFIVAKNPERPFFVTAGPVTVRAVGTAFNVRLASESIEVLVTEGRVKLQRDEAAPDAGVPPVPPASDVSTEAPALSEGQRAVIVRAPATPPKAAPVTIGDVDKAEIEAALGWQTTRLVFNNTPLDEVVAGFNRYNTHRLTIGDPKLRRRALTGVFRADNLDGFVRLLKASVDVKAEQRTPTETVLLPVR